MTSLSICQMFFFLTMAILLNVVKCMHVGWPIDELQVCETPIPELLRTGPTIDCAWIRYKHIHYKHVINILMHI